MNTVSSTRCKKCQKALGVNELKESDIGLICIDIKACEARIKIAKEEIKKS